MFLYKHFSAPTQTTSTFRHIKLTKIYSQKWCSVKKTLTFSFVLTFSHGAGWRAAREQAKWRRVSAELVSDIAIFKFCLRALSKRNQRFRKMTQETHHFTWAEFLIHLKQVEQNTWDLNIKLNKRNEKCTDRNKIK